MTQTAEQGLSGIAFVPRGSGMVVLTPSFLVGETGRRIYDAYRKHITENFPENENFQLRLEGNEVVEANVNDANIIDQVVRPFGGRVSLPKDWDEEFMQMTDNKHYTIANALVFRTLQDGYEPKNDRITQALAEHIDVERALREPGMITGFNFVPNQDESYGFIAVPAQRFHVHYDERFLGKYNGLKFDNTDDKGMPLHLDKQNGKRVWSTRDDGISGFDLNRSRGLLSSGYVLSYSYGTGRVVVVAAEGGALDLSEVLETQQRSELLGRLENARTYIQNLEESLRGKK
nr:hypothetical protein [uncultured archaeon]AQS34151.1 hypothetical protein [uncultured archaeon]